jgi:putative tricarboxylic transport membrane protein
VFAVFEGMFDAALIAAQHLFSPLVFLSVVAGVVMGMIVGAMPIGGNLPLVVVLMGFAFVLDPYIAMGMVVAKMAVNGTTDPIPAILLGIPGSASCQATVLDGYPLARRGLAGRALAAAYMSSLIGGLFGAVAFLAIIPFARFLLQQFGSAEFFLLGLIGISMVGIVSSGALVKGLLAAAFGLGIALIGTDPVLGLPRATFGSEFLYDGISLVPMIVGLFAVPEMLNLVVSDSPVAKQRLDLMLGEVNSGRRAGIMDALQHKWLVLRASFIGLFVGMLPGVGGSAAHWLAYAQARETEKGARQTFGKGDIRGVIAPEAANNSIDAGVLIPTLCFGIPGSGSMAVLMGFLILMGFIPGQKMLNEHLPLTMFVVFVLAISNVMAAAVALFLTPTLARIGLMKPNILAPLILALLSISVYQATSSLMNLWVVLGFSVLGTVMKRCGWPRPPLVIALVLAKSVEKYFSIALNAYGARMFARPQFLLMLALTVAAGAYMLNVQRKTRRMSARELEETKEAVTQAAPGLRATTSTAAE